MKILRVCLTYPRENMPGIGLPGYYHSNYSNYENLIITLKMDGKMISSKNNVKIKEIYVKNPPLGDFQISLFEKLIRYFLKSCFQLIFFLKSIKYIKNFKPDIVHVYSPIPMLFGIYCRYKYNSKFFLSLHGTDVERLAKNKFLQIFLKIPDKILSVSDNARERLNEVKLKSDISCIGNGYEKEVFYNYNNQRENQIITVGNLRWQKGHIYLIEAFAKFHSFHPEYKLIIIGSGKDLNMLKDKVNNLGLKKYVEFKGICSRDDISKELNKSKAFVLSSVIEGFPKVIIESMATGTPIVSTDVGNVKTLIEDSGFIVKPKDTENLFEAINKIIENDNWIILSKKSEELAQKYTWDSVVEKLEKIYRDF